MVQLRLRLLQALFIRLVLNLHLCFTINDFPLVIRWKLFGEIMLNKRGHMQEEVDDW